MPDSRLIWMFAGGGTSCISCRTVHSAFPTWCQPVYGRVLSTAVPLLQVRRDGCGEDVVGEAGTNACPVVDEVGAVVRGAEPVGVSAVGQRDVAEDLVVVGDRVDTRVGVREGERDDGDAAAVVADDSVVAHGHAVSPDGQDACAGGNQSDDVFARQDGVEAVVAHD